ncbi:MAG: DUF29 domain-containing protein [Microcystaceae cyanobacterium]
MTIATSLNQLYEIDNYQWLIEIIDLLKYRQFEQLDLDNLIEELEDLGSEKKNAVVSLLDQIIRHLLLLEYWQAEVPYSGTHWKGEVYNFRVQLQDKLTKTLDNYLSLQLEVIYRRALKAVKIKTEESINFPLDCPYSLAQLLDIDWLPK